MHLIKTPKNQVFLAIQVVILWHLVWIWMKCSSFKSIVQKIGIIEDQQLTPLTLKEEKQLKHIRAVYLATQKRWPYGFKCLINTLVCAIILNSEGIAFNLYLGLNKPLEGSLNAHSWIESNGWCITKEKRENFLSVTSFAPKAQ